MANEKNETPNKNQAENQPIRSLRENLARWLLIYPFLFVVGTIDFLIGCVVPFKYRDPNLPPKDTVLSRSTNPADPNSPYRSILGDQLIEHTDPHVCLYDEFQASCQKFKKMKTLGTREIISIDDEIQPNGKKFKKLSLGNYKWATYEEMLRRVDNTSNGLLGLNIKSGQNVVLFAETRPEWLITALACFKIKVTVVTLYSTLGIEALAYGINETQTSFLITSGEQLDKIEAILPKIPSVTHVIVITDNFNEKSMYQFKGKHATPKAIALRDVEFEGSQSVERTFQRPNKDDLAVIMYTSGSTGNPKGVMITHANLLTSFKAVILRMGTIKLEKDIYVAYLPLAHVLELCCELGCIIFGIRLAYSSPQTIADTSTAIKKGQKGDLRVLKPTIMASVPIVLERLSKTVYEKLSQTSWFKQLFFNIAYQQKLHYFRACRSTRLLDRLLFKRISSAVLGGKLRIMLCGGALLSKEVHEFAQVCLCPIMQCYGLTETCAAGTSQLPNHTDTETVGSVIQCMEFRLVDWPEANYKNTDKPNPRGEIYLGGGNVAIGYYNMPEKTKEDFKLINGVRYFATGDIGELLPNGNLKIIDRKKDLVKLSTGEYVSLNKVESVLKLLPFVDNCCVIAEPTKSNCVCLVGPNHKKIIEYLSGDQKKANQQLEDKLNEYNSIDEKSDELNKILDANSKLIEKLIKAAYDHCLKQGLDRFEIPTKLKFVKEIWTPDSGLVTDSLKLKRKNIEQFYKSEIDILYQ